MLIATKIRETSNDEESIELGDSEYRKLHIAGGLLLHFLSEKEKNYEEPTRKGTARGEPIGLSLKKYRAVLYSLTSLDLIRMSKKVGVYYGLLRKWRTEAEFKRRMKELTQEFAPLFIDSLLEKWVVQDKGFAEYMDTSASSISDRIKGYGLTDYNPEFTEDEVQFYSSPLKKVLIEQLFLLGDEDSFLFMFSPFITICRALADEKSSRERLLSEVLDQQKIANKNIHELIQMSFGVLADTTPDVKDRYSAIKWLEAAKEVAGRLEQVAEEVKKIIPLR